MTVAACSTKVDDAACVLAILPWASFSRCLSLDGQPRSSLQRKVLRTLLPGESLPSNQELKAALSERLATIGYVDDDAAVGEHELAWNGAVAIDCSNGEEVSLDNVVIRTALILTPVS